MTCKDCGLPLEPKCMESGDHPGLCCDCFDEGWGMPATQRTRPRPATDPKGGVSSTA